MACGGIKEDLKHSYPVILPYTGQKSFGEYPHVTREADFTLTRKIGLLSVAADDSPAVGPGPKIIYGLQQNTLPALWTLLSQALLFYNGIGLAGIPYK